MFIDPSWVIVIVSSSLAFSALSPIITARRLNFFASSLPHSALLSVSLGYLASYLLKGDPAFWAILISVPLSYLQTFLIQRGVDENTATSVFVAFTTSASVASLYYILTMFPSQVSLWSYILGDPLLVAWEDVVKAAIISLTLTALCILIYEKEVMIGVDREYAQLNGINVRFHDYLVITLLTVASVSLLRIVGFVIEHVVMLLPSAIALTVARNSHEMLWISIASALLSGILGLFVAVAVNLAPSAAFGLVLVTIYLVSLYTSGDRG
ncbi:MAG: metal ABC transporter permease [Infirmifilum sp.]